MINSEVYFRCILLSLLLFCVSGLTSCGSRSDNTQFPAISQRIDSLERAAMDSIYQNPSFAQAAIGEAISLEKDSLGIYKLLTVKSQIYFSNSQYDSGFVLNKAILDYCNRVEVTPKTRGMMGIIRNVEGNYYAFVGKEDSAIIRFTEAYNQIRLSDITHKIPDIYINMADMYGRKGAYDQRAYYFRQALFMSDSLDMLKRMGFPIYLGLGETYMELRDFELSNSFYSLAEKELETRNLSEKFSYCNSRGNFYYYKEEYDKALPWFRRARELVLSTKMDFYVNVCEINIGETYLFLNQLDSARAYLDNGFDYFVKYQNKMALYHLTTLKAALALKTGNPAQARGLLNSYTDTTGVGPQMIGLRNKHLQSYYETIGDYKHAYDHLRKNRELDNEIRGERMQMRATEIDMRYSQDTTLLKREIVIKAQEARVEHLELTRLLWILACLVLLALVCLVYFNMKKRRHIEWLNHIDQVTKLKMESIRNRVSPHFIFNVLNREISQEEGEFAKRSKLPGLVELLRSSLEITEKLTIPLSEEIRFVRTFLHLQSSSLGPDFSPRWEVDPDLDVDAVCIPAMLVQIPVENAIKHGLKLVTGKRSLLIAVRKCADGITIRIEDNGMGYQPMPAHGKKDSTGTGLKVLYRTIRLLNMKNKQKITYQVSNKSGEEGTGAIFSFFIPDNYNYAL